jgi:tagatose-6-phosphate ketose/aldose isomerase
MPGETILLVSFARSGNSPESIGAVALADRICRRCYHLIITCSGSGELANFRTSNPKYVFQLPERANDKSLAMTSSYSGMLLAGLLLARYYRHAQDLRQVDMLCAYGEKMLFVDAPMLQKVASLPFQRAVFLGSGPLQGVANESHLKLQELTDGKVICKYDSFLGLRHGPKAVVNGKTLVVYLLSNVPYVQRYEKDLFYSMDNGHPPMAEIAVSESSIAGFKGEYHFCFSDNGQAIDEAFLAICAVLPGQLLGFYKSLDLGLSPDSPSRSGAIHRVVEGVHIYPFS